MRYTNRTSRSLSFLAAIGLVLLCGAADGLAAPLTGEQIYKNQCASCHGAHGEGVKDEYPDALIGTRSLDSLTKYIDKRMPEGDAAKCVGDDAKSVASYIYDAFYSPVAQARRNTPKIELARLTTGQYRNAVADLIGSFRGASKPEQGDGLTGEYANASKRFREDKVALKRIDATVDFAFGDERPHEKVDKEEFAIRWTGGIHIPVTGTYEFIVHTKNGMRLWVNDDNEALIDAWVRSGESFEYRESRFLIGGRTYPIRLEIFKEKKEKASAVTLKWKQPQLLEQIIPANAMTPGKFEPVYVVQTSFPPDDRSMGYERGTFISKAWDEATTDAALDAATYIGANITSLAGLPSRTNRDDNARKQIMLFCERLAERAFRETLSPELKKFFVDRHFEGEQVDLDIAIKKAVLLILKSPRFLYHEAGPAQDQIDVASRMAFGMWDSLPDRELSEAARQGKLQTHEQVMAQLRRMAADPRTKAKMRGFFEQWLNLDRMHDLSKDAQDFPEFGKAVVADLRTSLDLFIEDVMWREGSDFRRLIQADHLHLNGRLAAMYGVDLPSDAPFTKVAVKHRAGVITHPLLMAGFAYEATTSPIHRGVFVSRNLLGRRLKPPPEAITPLSPAVHPEMTTRERTILQTSSKTCMACHAMINPLGFTFENFDAIGRFREQEKAKPVDATGFYETAAGDVANFKSAADLAAFLIESEEAQAAFIERLFHHAIKQPILAYGYDQPEKLRKIFIENDYNMARLLMEQVAAAAMIPQVSPAASTKGN